MLSKSNNRQLIDRGLDPKLVLFYQVWQELTYRWTIDTYKNKIFNTLNILQETVDVAEKTLAKIYLSYSNIQQCLAETLYLISYIEHLYDYIFIFTNEVIVCVVDKKVTNIDEALCILKENYDEFKFIASDKKTAMTVNDLICGGIINMI